MIKKVEEQILNGNFCIAQEIAFNSNISDLYEEILSMSYDKSSLAFYSFIISMLLKEASAKKHEMAAELLSFPLCFYKGAYSVALFHARKALKLEPNNLEYKTFLILFHDIPEHLVSGKEAYQVATEILHIDPTVIVAQKVITKYEHRSFDTDISSLPVFKISALLTDSLTKEMYLLLYYAKFEEARELVKDISFDELFKKMTTISQHEQTLTLYGYVVNLLLNEETAVAHQFASRVLVELLNSIEGAYVSGYWHAKKAVELASQDIEYKLWLLKFRTLPGYLLSDEDAVQLARSIIEIDPDNMEAMQVLSK